MVDIPDIKKVEEKLHDWGSYISMLGPFVGMAIAGAALVPYFALRAKPDIVHYASGLPPAFTALDDPGRWLLIAGLGFLLSVVFVGKAVLTKEKIRRASSQISKDRKKMDTWSSNAAEDEGLDPDSIFLINLRFKVDGHALTIDMEVDNRHSGSIKIMGVCVNWLSGSTAGLLLPHSLCVLSSESEAFKGPRQVAGTFALMKDLADFSQPGRAYITFAFTRFGITWKRWGNEVGATVQVVTAG